MPDLDIQIGGRTFQVACQPGEEHFLTAAAQMLDTEAQPLIAQMGRLTEARMLLMAGLMLADKTAAIEDEAKTLRARLAEAGGGQVAPASGTSAPIPQPVIDALAEAAVRAETLAASVEQRARRGG
jgi:cell division protein ZapA